MIKIDIEGEEMNALNGMQNLIMQYHPILAISIYHSPMDFYKIPRYILGLRADYKLYFRHYSQGIIESVAFFIPKNLPITLPTKSQERDNES